MGWKGTIRSLNAAVKRAEKHQRYVQKQNTIAHTANVVEQFDNYMERIISLHKVATETINWTLFATAQEPIEPVKKNTREEIATKKLAEYKPSFFIRLLSLTKWRVSQLKNNVIRESLNDQSEYNNNLEQFKVNYIDWKKNKEFAERILAGDAQAYHELIKEQNPFKEIGDISGEILIDVECKPLKIEAEINVDKVLPKEMISQLKNGKASVKEIPKTQYNSMYQDYVCSIALRLAREGLAYIPVDEVIVNISTQLLDSSTGHLSSQPILSIKILRKTLENLNFTNVDPSDCMKNFIHNMNFKKTEGLGPVKKVA